MSPVEAFELEKHVARLGLSDGQVIALAREVSHCGTLLSLAHLSKRDRAELAFRLTEIEQRQFAHELELAIAD